MGIIDPKLVCQPPCPGCGGRPSIIAFLDDPIVVQQDAERVPAGTTEETPDPHQHPLAATKQPQHLTLIGPVPHDLEAILSPRWSLAKRTAGRPKLFDRRKATQLGQGLDGDGKRACDHNHLLDRGWRAYCVVNNGGSSPSLLLRDNEESYSSAEYDETASLRSHSMPSNFASSMRSSHPLAVPISPGSVTGNGL